MAKRNTYGVDEELETPFNIKNLLRCKPYILHNIKPLIGGETLSAGYLAIHIAIIFVC